MYTAFYGLREKPFVLTPNPRFLYLAESHREAMAHLLYGLEQGEGFIVISGEVGTGKTTICRSLLDRMGAETEIAILFNPSRTANELLQSINDEFDLPSAGLSRRELLSRLNTFLLEKHGESRRVVLIIDEAQNLSPGTLEQVRLLSNLETTSSKLIQIILLGQPELDEKLDSDELRQLRQRVTVRWSLQPLPRDDTFGYVRHRLQVAAGAERDIFTDAALREIHRQTRGIPRLINVLCDRILLAGYAAGAHRIGPKLVKQASKEVPEAGARARKEPSGRAWRYAAALGAALAAAWLMVAFWQSPWSGTERAPALDVVRRTPEQQTEIKLRQPEIAGTATVVAPVTPQASPLRDDEVWVGLPAAMSALPTQSSSPEELDGVVSVAEGQGSFLAALLAVQDERTGVWKAANAILERYGRDEIDSPPETFEGLLSEITTRDLGVVTLNDIDFRVLEGLNYPALLTLQADNDEPRTVALLALEGDVAELVGTGPSTRLRVPIAAIEERWEGDAYVIWQPFEQIPEVLTYGEEGAGVLWLQDSLVRLGYLENGITGLYDDPTFEGVQRFQLKNQIEADGVAGPLTQMLLYDELGDYSPPRLVEPAEDAG